MRPRILAGILALLIARSAPAHAQSWTPGPSFPEAPAPRLQGAAVLYLGRIYMLGGSPFDTTSDHNGATDFLDYGDATFIPGPVLDGPFVSQGAGIDALGRPVVFGGWTGPNGDRGGTYVFDPTNGKGLTLPSRSAQAPSANFAWTTDASGRIYSLGGGPGESATASKPNSTRVERFDALANAWAVLAPMPAALANSAGTEDGAGHVLVFGGVNTTATTRVATVLRYDIASDTWSSVAVPPLPAPLSNARAVHGPDQRIYVIGGVTGPIGAGAPSAAVWVLDQRTNTWSAGPAMSTPRADPAVIYDPDYASVFAMGGNDGAGGSFTSEMLAVATCPTFAAVASPETLCVGRTAAFEADAQGDEPIGYQWRRNGLPLADGPTGTGSAVAGSATRVLTVSGITAADAAAYDVVATNACGFVSSPAAGLVVTPAPLLPGAADWTATSEAFSSHVTSFNAIAGGVVAGGADAVRTGSPARGQYFFHNLQWDGIAGDATSSLSIGIGIGSEIFGAAGPLSVGYRQYLIGGPRGSQGIEKVGVVWANVNGVVSMQTLAYGIPTGTDGAQIVGTNGISAFVWNAPGPGGPWSSYPLGPGFASACALGNQYGQSNGHATRWSASAAATDLNPAGAGASELLGAAGEDQSGDFTTGARHAGLWHGAAIGVVDLSPAGSDSSASTACGGAYQAGYACFGGASHAMIWGASAGRNVDLGAVAGAGYASTWANAMEVDPLGNLAVAGGGVRVSDGETVGLLWTTTPYAEILRQPVATSVALGHDTSLVVVARGNGGVLYQWRKDGAALEDGGRISGSRTAELEIAHVGPADGGLYDVLVSNALRSVDSTPVALTVLGNVGVDSRAPAATRFAGAWPMPVRAGSAFHFDLAHPAHVRLQLYDVTGRWVRTFLDESRPAGSYAIPWEAGARPITAGIYYARFEADGVKATRAVVLAR